MHSFWSEGTLIPSFKLLRWKVLFPYPWGKPIYTPSSNYIQIPITSHNCFHYCLIQVTMAGSPLDAAESTQLPRWPVNRKSDLPVCTLTPPSREILLAFWKLSISLCKPLRTLARLEILAVEWAWGKCYHYQWILVLRQPEVACSRHRAPVKRHRCWRKTSGFELLCTMLLFRFPHPLNQNELLWWGLSEVICEVCTIMPATGTISSMSIHYCYFLSHERTTTGNKTKSHL